MSMLLTGVTGQVGFELLRSLQPLGPVIALPRSALDLSNPEQVRSVIRALRPRVIINAAAYTAVDKAEGDADLAYRINAEAPAVMAAEAATLGAAMVHFSTDYVFDGRKQGPYLETDAPRPLNVYGASKLAGEEAIRDSGIAHLILRTSWVYSLHGNNFLLTMLKRSQECEELAVVADQLGAPTWSRTIADTTCALLAQARCGGHDWWETNGGLYHLSGQGSTSWHGFAEAILAMAGSRCRVVPITSASYPAAARRPVHSLLSGEKLARLASVPQWDDALAMCMQHRIT